MKLVASPQPGIANQTDIFFFDDDGSLNIYFIQGNSGGLALKIGPLSRPNASLAVSQQFGLTQTDVFFSDVAHGLNVLWHQAGGNWSDPTQIDVQNEYNYAAGEFAVSRQFGADQTNVYVIDVYGQLDVVWVTKDHQWNGPIKIGHVGSFPTGNPLAASQQMGHNQTDVFTCDPQGQLYVYYVLGQGNWRGPHKIGPPGFGATDGPPFLAASRQFGATNQTDVFAFGPGGLTVVWVDGQGAWQGPHFITTETTGTPEIAVARQSNTDLTDVFFLREGKLYNCWVDGAGHWNGPKQIGTTGGFRKGYIAASKQFGTNQTDVFVLGPTGLNYFSVAGDHSWQGPTILPS